MKGPVVLCTLLLLCAPLGCIGQVVTGDILGTITDPSGGVVARPRSSLRIPEHAKHTN